MAQLAFRFSARTLKLKTMDLSDRITVDPSVAAGKAVIAGTAISVDFIVDLLASGRTSQQILKNSPHLSEDAILSCLHYASTVLEDKRARLLAQGKIRDYRGKLKWKGDLDTMRSDH
jgi:uncharacterized protein (DUF433 family)